MDCTFKTEKGKFNYRVGAIIRNGNRILMARNPGETRGDMWYSVGGRVRFGETAEEACLRELKEETGLKLELERLAAIHENFFRDAEGTLYHEISFFFLIKPDERLYSLENGHPTTDGPDGEVLEWLDLSDCADKQIYPEFFKTTDFSKEKDILHFITRKKTR